MFSKLTKTAFFYQFVGLGFVIFVGTALRFWNLDLKPLWLDEVITAIFTLGRTYTDIATGQIFPLSHLETLFSWQESKICPAIAEAIRIQSTHPPLFFCWIHQWLGWLQGMPVSLAWKLRSFPALMGVASVGAVYALASIAFSGKTGLMAAALMAVSPFAVYLSQEARHYTLPMLVATLALMGCIQIQQDLYERKALRPWVWWGWIAINALGFYVHYFFLLIFFAQSLTLLVIAYWKRAKLPRQYKGILTLAITLVGFTYLPWLPQLQAHIHSPATEWATTTNTDGLTGLAVLLRWIAGWITMIVVLPMENQPLGIRRMVGVALLAIAGWCVWQVGRGLKQLWQKPQAQLSVITLVGFIACVFLAYFIGIYGFGRDMSRVFRYNFTVYPAVVVMCGASLTHLPTQPHKLLSQWRRYFAPTPKAVQRAFLGLGLLSSSLVVSGFAFYKPYYPDQIVQRIALNPAVPLLVVQEYNRPQDLAFGLSLALALKQRIQASSLASPQTYWSFIPVGEAQSVNLWTSPLSSQLLSQPLELWSVSDRSPVRWDFINFLPMGKIRTLERSLPPKTLGLRVNSALTKPLSLCTPQANFYELLGTTYQQYRCKPI